MNRLPKNELKMLVLDVDGTLTDGRIVVGQQGEALKNFSVQDGLGLQMMRVAGVQVAILTGRQSAIVEHRAAELGIALLRQGVASKAEALPALCAEAGVTLAETAYMGDDLNDLAAMALCGFAACPADAARDVRAFCGYVADAKGGRGAVREFCESYLRDKGLWQLAVKRQFGAVVE